MKMWATLTRNLSAFFARSVGSLWGTWQWIKRHHLTLLGIATLIVGGFTLRYARLSAIYQEQAVAGPNFDIELESGYVGLAQIEPVNEQSAVVYVPFGQSFPFHAKITNLGQMAARKPSVLFEATEGFEDFGASIPGPFWMDERLGQRHVLYRTDWFNPRQVESFQIWVNIRKGTPDSIPKVKVTVDAENLDRMRERWFEFREKKDGKK